MIIELYPQYQLYILTLHMFLLKNQLIPENCDDRCVNATIINRAYCSAYLYCELWLEDVMGFKVKHPWDFKDGEEQIGAHKQVREALNDFEKSNTKSNLFSLFKLRVKADYDPFVPITLGEVDDALNYMEKIFAVLQFE